MKSPDQNPAPDERLPGTDSDDRFDRRAHARYSDAAKSLTPAMQGRLRAARRSALTVADNDDTQSRRLSGLVPVAAIAAAAFALAIGLHFLEPTLQQPRALPEHASASNAPAAPDTMPPRRESPPVHAPSVPTSIAESIAQIDDPALLLEEDPDFYLWLGSDDALPLLLEQDHDST